jgi:NADH-quinone oxidoreductase subunit A
MPGAAHTVDPGAAALAAYLPIAIYLAVLVGFAALLIILSHLIVPRNVPRSERWTQPYECGLKSEGLPLARYPVKYYLAAIIFVIFDLEAVFFYPWAVSLGTFKDAGYGPFWFMEMLVFVVILLVGYVYLLAKGVFNWSEEPK